MKQKRIVAKVHELMAWVYQLEKRLVLSRTLGIHLNLTSVPW